MDREQRQANYLSKAREAEQEAQKAKSPEARASCLKIADSYRQLARKT